MASFPDCIRLLPALFILGCSTSVQVDPSAAISQNLRLAGPALLRGNQTARVRSATLLTVSIERDSPYARRFLDYAGRLSQEKGRPYLLRWQVYLPSGKPVPSGFYQQVPSLQVEAGQDSSLQFSLSSLAPAGTYTLELRCFHGRVPHENNAVDSPLKQHFELVTPPALTASIQLSARYAVANTGTPVVGADQSMIPLQDLIPADEKQVAHAVLLLDQAQANSFYSMGQFRLENLPGWVKRISFRSTVAAKTNTAALSALADGSDLVISRIDNAGVLASMLIPLQTKASGSISQAKLTLSLYDRDGLSLPLEILISTHVT